MPEPQDHDDTDVAKAIKRKTDDGPGDLEALPPSDMPEEEDA